MTSNQTITRWAKPEDKPSIAKLLHGLMVYTAGVHGMRKDDVRSVGTVAEALEKVFVEPDNIRFVVVEKDSSVAAICCVETSYSTWNAKPYMVLNDVFVDPTYRGMGFGKALVKFVADHAHESGCCRLDLVVELDNDPAQKLYEACGFKRQTKASYSLPIQPAEGLP